MKVLVFPRDPGSNPYQRLLYDELQKTDEVEIEYLPYSLRNLLLLPLILRSKYREGFGIFHLHWPNFYVYKKIPLVRFASFLLSSYCIRALRFSKLKLVWTVHNVLPHDPETTNDLMIAKYLAKYASAKIVHSGFTIDQMQELGMDTKNCHIVAHGNYDGVYPNSVTRETARQKLKLSKNDLVILFFGTIKAYKGVDTLLDEFKKLGNKNVRLLIAGTCSDKDLNGRIEHAAEESGRIVYRPGFVKDEDVASYFQACDVVCLPFTSITTSGSALLALTFQKPVIAPATGALLDIPKSAGFFYEPSDMSALGDILKSVVNNPKITRDKVEGAKRYAASVGWDKIARQTHEVYDSVCQK